MGSAVKLSQLVKTHKANPPVVNVGKVVVVAGLKPAPSPPVKAAPAPERSFYNPPGARSAGTPAGVVLLPSPPLPAPGKRSPSPPLSAGALEFTSSFTSSNTTLTPKPQMGAPSQTQAMPPRQATPAMNFLRPAAFELKLVSPLASPTLPAPATSPMTEIESEEAARERMEACRLKTETAAKIAAALPQLLESECHC